MRGGRTQLAGVKDRDVVAQAEELAESKAADGGTVGTTADEPDDVIGEIQSATD